MPNATAFCFNEKVRDQQRYGCRYLHGIPSGPKNEHLRVLTLIYTQKHFQFAPYSGEFESKIFSLNGSFRTLFLPDVCHNIVV